MSGDGDAVKMRLTTRHMRLNKDGQGGRRDEKEDLQDKYSPQELSLLRLLQSENKYMKTLDENDGMVGGGAGHVH